MYQIGQILLFPIKLNQIQLYNLNFFKKRRYPLLFKLNELDLVN